MVLKTRSSGTLDNRLDTRLRFEHSVVPDDRNRCDGENVNNVMCVYIYLSHFSATVIFDLKTVQSRYLK